MNIYNDSTIAFVTAAAQTCLLIERASEHERQEWREQMLRLLPVLYLRTRLLEPEEAVLEEEPQRFVTEEDYNIAPIGMRAVFTTAPTPVRTAQPKSAASTKGTAGSMRTTERRDITARSAKADTPR